MWSPWCLLLPAGFFVILWCPQSLAFALLMNKSTTDTNNKFFYPLFCSVFINGFLYRGVGHLHTWNFFESRFCMSCIGTSRLISLSLKRISVRAYICVRSMKNLQLQSTVIERSVKILPNLIMQNVMKTMIFRFSNIFVDDLSLWFWLTKKGALGSHSSLSVMIIVLS